MVDVALVADSSESVFDAPNNVDILFDFISDIIEDSDVDTGNVRFALSVFTHDIYNHFFLNTFTTRAEMIAAIEASPIRQGGTNTGGALENVHSQIFLSVRGDRMGAQNIAVIITDGKSNNYTYTVEQAALAKAAGIHIITIGIAMTDVSELYQIASDPVTENVFNVNDFNGLYSIEGVIEQKFIEECTGMSIYKSVAILHYY